MIQSQEKVKDKRFIEVGMLGPKLAEQEVWIRARLHTSRATGKFLAVTNVFNEAFTCFYFIGKQCFFVLRQGSKTVQCLAFISDLISRQMVKFISRYI